MLPPLPGPGQALPAPPVHVHFTCCDFGKTVSGTLSVHTKELQYTFRVLGRQPAYAPPDMTTMSPKVDSRIDADLLATGIMARHTQSQKTNFQLENVLRTRGVLDKE